MPRFASTATVARSWYARRSASLRPRSRHSTKQALDEPDLRPVDERVGAAQRGRGAARLVWRRIAATVEPLGVEVDVEHRGQREEADEPGGRVPAPPAE
jgi:hypothetical protein